MFKNTTGGVGFSRFLGFGVGVFCSWTHFKSHARSGILAEFLRKVGLFTQFIVYFRFHRIFYLLRLTVEPSEGSKKSRESKITRFDKFGYQKWGKWRLSYPLVHKLSGISIISPTRFPQWEVGISLILAWGGHSHIPLPTRGSISIQNVLF